MTKSMGEKIIKLKEWDAQKYEFVNYVASSWKKDILYNPITYKANQFTKNAWGEEIKVSFPDLVELAETKPKAFLKFSVSAGAREWFQVKNIKMIVMEKFEKII